MIYFPFSCRLNAGGRRSWSTLVSSTAGKGAGMAQAPVMAIIFMMLEDTVVGKLGMAIIFMMLGDTLNF